MIAKASAVPGEGGGAKRAGPGGSLAEYWGPKVLVAGTALTLGSFAYGFDNGLRALTVLGFLCVIVGLYRPALGTIGVGLLCTIDAPSRVLVLTGGLLRWNSFNYWLLIALVLGIAIVPYLRGLPMRALQLLTVLLAVQLLFSESLENGVQHVLALVTAMGIALYFYRTAQDRTTWYWTAVVSGVVAALGTFVYYAQRSSLPYINPNAYSYFPLTALFASCVAVAVVPLKGRRQLWLALLSAVNFGWVFLTGSRGGLAVAACCALYLLLTLRGFELRTALISGAAIALLLVTTVFTDLQLASAHRFEKLMDSRSTLSERTSGRSELLIAGLEIFERHPLGVGTGDFASRWFELSLQSDVRGLSGWHRGTETEAHSAWIKVLAENGLPGIVLLGLFVGSFALLGLRQPTTRLRLFGWLVSLALAAAFVTTEFQSKGVWLLAMAGAVVLPASPGNRIHARW